jgi:hypothetical protein
VPLVVKRLLYNVPMVRNSFANVPLERQDVVRKLNSNSGAELTCMAAPREEETGPKPPFIVICPVAAL